MTQQHVATNDFGVGERKGVTTRELTTADLVTLAVEHDETRRQTHLANRRATTDPR